jgi:ABC-type transporter Mla subunit MlaD
MTEVTEKYLARMLEGAEQGLAQVEAAIDQINDQLTKMHDQRDELNTAVTELKDLLGLEEEEQEEDAEN